jgi:uncharacterized integral membrane protein
MANDSDAQANESHAGELAKLIPALILVGVLVVFCLANTQKVTVDFLATETEAPLILVLVVTAVVGALLGALLRFSRRHD